MVGREGDEMSRLIDALALCELANNNITKSVDANDIMRFPTVDAVPVVHGHWEDYLKSGLKYRCSFCKSRFNTAWEYCPHCGAKMDEVTE